MTPASPTNIFQYEPTQKKPSDSKKKTIYWLSRVHDHLERKTIRAKDFIGRVKSKEQNHTTNSQMRLVPDNREKTPEARGIEQHEKNIRVKIESDKYILEDLIRKSNRSIFSISSVFPWAFFPNTIDVEESRVTFIFRQLFASQSHSVDIKDISNVFIESGFFFAKLQIVSRTFIQNDIKIDFLNKKDAYRAKNIIEGLRTFIQNDINSSNYEIGDLVDKLKELNIPKTIN